MLARVFSSQSDLLNLKKKKKCCFTSEDSGKRTLLSPHLLTLTSRHITLHYVTFCCVVLEQFPCNFFPGRSILEKWDKEKQQRDTYLDIMYIFFSFSGFILKRNICIKHNSIRPSLVLTLIKISVYFPTPFPLLKFTLTVYLVIQSFNA